MAGVYRRLPRLYYQRRRLLAGGKTAATPGVLEATAAIAFNATADLDALGTLAATGAIVLASTADLDATGSLAATGAIAFNATADLDALASLSATGGIVVAATADLDATGTLAATGAIAVNATADLDATGSIAATGAIAFNATADLDALGSLASTGAIVLSATADLDATGSLAATGAAAVNATADLDATGSLAATAAIAVNSTALLTDSIDVTATAAVVVGATADLDATGTLAATGAIAVSATASLIDANAVNMTATAAIVAGATASLTGYNTGFWPAPSLHFERTRNRTNHRLRVPPELNEYPDPPTYADSYPAIAVHFEKTKRTRFNLRVLPRHDQWTQTATFAAVMPSFVTHFEPTRNRTNHRRVDVPHNEWTQAVTTPAVYPSFVTHFERTRNVTNHRRLDVVLTTFEPPPTPPTDIIIGSVPAFITRTIASRKHRYVNVFPDYGDPVVADAAVYPSFVQWGSHKFGFSIRRQILKTDADRLADVVTDPVQDEEEFPAWLPPKANRVTFTRRRRELPSFEDWANAQASTDAAVVGAIFRPEFRRRRKAPELTVVYSDIILADKAQDVFLAPYVPRPVAFRRVGKRRHLAAPEMAPIAADNPTPTTAAVYPAFVPPPTLRREYRVTLRRAPDPVDLPVVQIDEPLANVLVKVVPRRRTQRRLVLPLPIVEGAVSEAAALDEPFVATTLNRSTRHRFIYNRRVSVLGYPGEALPEFKCEIYLQGAISETIYLSAAMRSEVTYIGVAQFYGDIYLSGSMSDEVYVRTHLTGAGPYLRGEMC